MKKQKQEDRYKVEIPKEFGDIGPNQPAEGWSVQVISPTGIQLAIIRRKPDNSGESTLQGYMQAAAERFSNSAYWSLHRQAGYSLRLGKASIKREPKTVKRFIVRVLDSSGQILKSPDGSLLGLLSTATKSRADKFALILASSVEGGKAEVIDREQQRELWEELRLVLIGS